MKHAWIFFVIGAALSWGAYVPAIHHGQLGFSGPNRALRAFLFVGVAYFLMAVVVPALVLAANPDNAGFTRKGITISTVAGALGALGALCVIFALRSGGRPLVVAPLIFGLAPIVNVLVATAWDWRDLKKPATWPFYVGILLAALGAALVLRFKPS